MVVVAATCSMLPTLSAQSASNSLLSVSPDGQRLACSNRDSGTIALIDAGSMQRVWETRVGRHPEGTTFVGDSGRIAVCVYGADQIVILKADDGTIEHRIDVYDEPYGIVSSPDGQFLYATLEYPGQVIRINVAEHRVDRTWEAGQMLRGIALDADREQLLVTEYLTAAVLKLSAVDGQQIARYEGASTDNIARQVTLHPQLPKAYLPHIRSRIRTAHGNGSIFPYVTAATLEGEDEGRRMRIPMDTFRGTRVVANPWEVTVSPDGRQVLTIFSATNDMYVANVEFNDYQELGYAATLRLGSNPRAVRYGASGTRFFVYNALDFEVVRYDARTLRETGRVTTTNFPLEGDQLLGKKLFYTARQPMSGRQWIACSSCHIDGDADGRTWQQPEGLRQTQPLAALAWTHPLHWSADRDEVQDFEHTIRGKLMQGRGLLSGSLPDALETPITGRSQMLDALAVYTNSHRPSMSPHAKQGLSAAARRGRALFLSKSTRCASCHSGPFYSDSQPGKAPQHDVGTGRTDETELMGTAYDTPTLLGIYRSAPYLHDGSAATLRDVLTTANPNDQHGVTSQLTAAEVDDLVEFLKALPFEDPEPAARQAGLQQVTGRETSAEQIRRSK